MFAHQLCSKLSCFRSRNRCQTGKRWAGPSRTAPFDRAHETIPSASQRGQEQAKQGFVWLVGAGPGPKEYLTLRAVELLKQADVVIYDDLGTQDALSYVRPGAELIWAGKRGGDSSSTPQAAIDQLLVQHAGQGSCVVRLKGGCASVFSRVGSEMRALTAAGIGWQMVPGISSVLAAPLAAGMPLTDHPLGASSFAVVTGHDLAAHDWSSLARMPVLVVLMAGKNLGQMALLLQQHGKQADTPVAVVRSACLPQQRVWRSTLGCVADVTSGQGPLSPCVVVVGEVVRLADLLPGMQEE